jgi:hypothetical protein
VEQLWGKQVVPDGVWHNLRRKNECSPNIHIFNVLRESHVLLYNPPHARGASTSEVLSVSILFAISTGKLVSLMMVEKPDKGVTQ